jgi:hypothetical protein
MNSITSNDQDLSESVKIGDRFYVPFWIILQFLDVVPPDPFIEVIVDDTKWHNATTPDGRTNVLVCDLKCIKPHVMASGIPASYLIKPEELGQWADDIGAWFSAYPVGRS